VEDDADDWDPPGSGRSYGPSCRRGRREKEMRGSKDISHELADSVPPCQVVVACHISQSGKNVEAAAIIILNI